MVYTADVRSATDTGSAPWFRDRQAIVAFCVFAVVMGALSLLRYTSFHSRSLDMAYYVRMVWGLAHGHYDQPVVGAPHMLGLHLQPVLLLFALPARAGVAIAPTLLVVQALCAAAAIFPAHTLARRHLGRIVGPRWAFVAALCIYLIPTVTRCVDYDVHPSTMALWPLLAWISAVDDAPHTGRWRRAWIWFFVCLLFREDIGLQLAACALTFVIVPGRLRGTRTRIVAASMAGLGLIWFFGYALYVQPKYLPPSGSLDLHFAAFGGGGGGVGAILRTWLAHPDQLLVHMGSDGRLVYPLLLLLPVAFLPVFAPRWLAGALPLVLINLISDVPGVRTLQAHYITAGAPFFFAAAVAGCENVAARLGRYAAGAPATLLFAGLLAWFLRGASPGSPEWTISAYQQDEYARRARAWVSTLPDDAPVVAPSRILAHTAERIDVRHPKFAKTGPSGEFLDAESPGQPW